MSVDPMYAKALRRRIKRLEASTPLHKALERELREGVGFNNAWYRSQKEHWLGWLAEYDGAGAYGRKVHKGKDARFIYNHIQCAPMLFWLAEAVGVDGSRLNETYTRVIEAPSKNASQCGALRKVISWDDIAPKLPELGPTLIERVANWKPFK